MAWISVDALPLLVDNVFNSSFHSYELLDALPVASEQTGAALADPKVAVFDKLHEVAFRTGLGNSVFASDEALHSLTRADLLDYAKKHFTADKIAIVGSGVSHGDLKGLVEASFGPVTLSTDSAEAKASRYYGGEARISAGPGSPALYAVAYPGVSADSADYKVALVLRGILDGTKRVKWGCHSGTVGLLGSTVTEETQATAFNVSYSDAGLIGFLVEGKDDEVKTVASKAVSALKSIASGVSSESLERGKKVAIVDAESSLTLEGIVGNLSDSNIKHASFHAGPEVLAINQVTAKDVQKVNII